jgi:tetratricopeptide (TPR) repeat protein
MGWKQVVVIVSALLTIVLLYILPTPNSKYRSIDIKSSAEVENLSNPEKLKKGLEIIKGGGAPMEGIKLLKEVEASEPDNQEVLFYLGDFSLKTGQFDKAIPRFKHLTELAPKEAQYWYLLGQAYELSKNNNEAIKAYQTFIGFNTDSIIVSEVKNKINALK